MNRTDEVWAKVEEEIKLWGPELEKLVGPLPADQHTPSPDELRAGLEAKYGPPRIFVHPAIGPIGPICPLTLHVIMNSYKDRDKLLADLGKAYPDGA